jgi:predicted amidophosphoribosyltransferase
MPLSALLELVFPDRCPACDALTDGRPGLCPRCAASLYPLGAACPRCAEPQTTAGTPLPCARCRRQPPPFRRAHAPWRYGGELATALRRAKYGGPRAGGRPELVRGLAALFAPALVTAATRAGAHAIVPVPLHPRRLAARGYPQAQRLCEAVHALLHAPLPRLLPFALVRTRDTAVQASLPLARRAMNVAGAFDVPPAARTIVRGLDLLLVDDVLTTGETARACARALLRAGARTVDVVALARAEA